MGLRLSSGRIRRVAKLTSVSVALTMAACDAREEDGWGGTMSDSSGITVVSNPASGLWKPESAWRLREDLRIGVAVGSPEREFGRIAGVAVGSAGQIYVLDRQASEVRIFDRDGSFIRSVGRAGSGPGELRSPSWVLVGQDDTIFVPDAGNQRLQRFDRSGVDAGSFRLLASDGIAMGWDIRDDGTLLEWVRTLVGTEQMILLSRAGDGAIQDTLAVMPVGEAMTIRDGQPFMTMFAPEPMWALLSDGRIATGRTSRYTIEIRTASGALGQVVKKPFESQRFGPSDQRAFRELLSESLEAQGPSEGAARMLQSLSYSDQYPAALSLLGGPDGSLWVQRALAVSAITSHDLEDFDVRGFGSDEWDVFDRQGRFLGAVSFPPGFKPMASDGDAIYGVARDELGVQQVVRLRVEH